MYICICNEDLAREWASAAKYVVHLGLIAIVALPPGVGARKVGGIR